MGQTEHTVLENKIKSSSSRNHRDMGRRTNGGIWLTSRSLHTGRNERVWWAHTVDEYFSEARQG